MNKILKKISLVNFAALFAIAIQANASGGVTPAGIEDYDGSFTYDSPEVLVDGANIPIVNDGNNYNASGFCALRGKTFVNATSGNSPGGNVADLSQTGQLIGVAAYTSIVTSVVCNSGNSDGTPTIVISNGVIPTGSLNFDGSMSYDNPQVSVDGAYLPLVNDGNNYNASGFCALQGKTFVNAMSGNPISGQLVADISQSGQLIGVASYTSIVTNVICR